MKTGCRGWCEERAFRAARTYYAKYQATPNPRDQRVLSWSPWMRLEGARQKYVFGYYPSAGRNDRDSDGDEPEQVGPTRIAIAI